MAIRAGMRSVTSREPCAVCGRDSLCLRTVDGFRLMINRGGALAEVDAPGSVFCSKGLGDVPGWARHGKPGGKGLQCYVPAEVYRAIKGGAVAGTAISEAEFQARQAKARAEQDRTLAVLRRKAQELWHSAGPRGKHADPGVVAAYLEARGIRLRDLPGGVVPPSLRGLKRCEFWGEGDDGTPEMIGESPAVIAATLNPRGELCGVHRIYLRPDCSGKLTELVDAHGRTHEVAAKKYLGDQQPGAAVRMWDERAVDEGGPETLIITEGIETAAGIAAAVGGDGGVGVGVLSVISSAGMQRIVLPPRWMDPQIGKVRRIIFAADLDRYSEATGYREGPTKAILGASSLMTKHGWDTNRIVVRVPSADVAPRLVGSAPGRSDRYGDVLLGAKDGKEGKTVDWLDVLVDAGSEAVRVGLGVGVGERKGDLDEPGTRNSERGVDASGHDGDGDQQVADAGEEAAPFDAIDVEADGAAVRSGGEGGSVGVGDGVRARRSAGARGAARAAGDGGSESGASAGARDGGGGGGDAVAGSPGERGGDGAGGRGGRGLRDVDAGGGESIPPILPRGHLAQAREAIAAMFGVSDEAAERARQRWELAYHNGQFLEYVGTHWTPVDREVLASRVLNYFEGHCLIKKKPDEGDRIYKMPTAGIDGKGATRDVAMHRAGMTYGNAESVVSAMVGDANVHAESLPAWVEPTFDGAGNPRWGGGLWRSDGEQGRSGLGHTAAKNGLIRLDALMENKVVLDPHTPRYVATSSLPFDVPVELVQQQIDRDPEDEEMGGELVRALCPTWLTFLDEAAGGCDVWKMELGKFFGLCLTDRVMDRAAFLIGQARTGKGTIAETLVEVVGEDHVHNARLESITGKHDLTPFYGKRLAFFDEVEVGHMTDTAAAVGRLKTLIAGTPVTGDPKHERVFNFRFTGKMILTANKLPRLRDASNALAGRLLVFPTQGESRVGREDYTLKDRIKAEARGVFVWSIFHLRALLRSNRFVQPPEGEKVLENFRRLSSPLYAFLKDCMVVDAAAGVSERLLRELYEAWANHEGIGRMGQETFLADMMAAVPKVTRTRRTPLGGSGGEQRVLLGVRPRLHEGDEEKARAMSAAGKEQIIWRSDVDRMATYGFDFPAGEGRGGGSGGGGGGGGVRVVEYKQQNEIPY